MKPKVLLSLFLCLCAVKSFAQDIIVKNDKTEIKSKVIEIEEDKIKYKKWDNMSGPVYNISKRDVFMILYANGQREIIDNTTSTGRAAPVNETRPVTAPVVIPAATPVPSSHSASVATPATSTESTEDKSPAFYRFGMGINSGATLGYFAGDLVGKSNFATSGGLMFAYAGLDDADDNYVTTFSTLLGVSYYLNDVFNTSYDKFSMHSGLLVGYSAIYSSFVDETTYDFWLGGRVGAHLNLTKGFGIFGDGLWSFGGGVSGIGGLFFKL